MGTALREVRDATERAPALQLRAVDYLRVSTEEQKKGYGIAYTGKRTRRHIEKKGWVHVGTFADEGYSGSLDHTQRPDLKDLMAQARQDPRPFDVVVVHEERAIGRRDRAFWPWVWELEDLGVFVAVVRGDYDNTTEEGASRMRKEADRAQDERLTIRNRTQGGIQEKAETGGHPGGRPRYGYRIADKGELGLSHIEVDSDDESRVLRRAWTFVVLDGENCRQAAAGLNDEGLLTRSGAPWTADNLRQRLHEAASPPRVIFRAPHRAKLDRDGRPRFGETLTLELPEILNASEREQLALALRREHRPSAPGGAVFTLSRRVASPCGRHYTGLDRGRSGDRIYQCAGRKEAYPGAPRCDCAPMEADALEAAVWQPLRNLLSDPGRLRRMSQDWLEQSSAEAQGADPEGRIADLDAKFAEQEQVIQFSTRAAAKEAARRGLDEAAAEALIARTIQPFQRELDDLDRLRQEAVAWKQRIAQAELHARDLQSLATAAGNHLHALTPLEQAEILSLLKIRVTPLEAPHGRPTRPCPLGAWFREQGRLVPLLDDDAWIIADPVLSAARRRRRGGVGDRLLLEGLFHKARTGCPWAGIPERYGPSNSVQTAYLRWVKAGTWEAVVDALEGVEGTPPPPAVALPSLRITGTAIVDRLLTEMGSEVISHSKEPSRSGWFGQVTIDFIVPKAA